MKIFHIKLINGEEIISKAKIVDETMELKNPLSVNYTYDEDGPVLSMLGDYLKYSVSKECVIDMNKIITYTEVPDEIAVYYRNNKYFSEEAQTGFMRQIVSANKKMKDFIVTDQIANSDDMLLTDDLIAPTTNSFH